jgi:hypothetical protein
MVIGERFAWSHLPKTGGDATLELFRIFPGLILHADPADSQDKHTHFDARESEVGGKVLAMNIRRLPTWLLSRAHHATRRGRYPDYKPLPMESPREMAESTLPDQRLSEFTGGGRFGIDRWIRMESLTEDFLAFISEFTDPSEEERARVVDLGRVNVLQYDHEIEHWFDEEQIREMYRRNPIWAGVERKRFGNLLAE